MENSFQEPIFTELNYRPKGGKSSLIKASEVELVGKIKISVEDDEADGVKILLRKDELDNIKEIKFMCSCGITKSIILDYSEQ